MVRFRFDTRPSLGLDSCDLMVCNSHPPMHGPTKQASRANRSFVRNSLAASSRARSSWSDQFLAPGGSSAEARTSKASRWQLIACELLYHSLTRYEPKKST
jgi:hypothetical protein